MTCVIAHNSRDFVRWESLPGCVGRKFTLAVPRHSVSLGPRPEFSGYGAIQGCESITLNSWCGAVIEGDKANPIKPRQAVVGSQPEITVGGLTHVTNDVLRQSILRCPHIDVVLDHRGRCGTQENHQSPKTNCRAWIEAVSKAPGESRCRGHSLLHKVDSQNRSLRKSGVQASRHAFDWQSRGRLGKYDESMVNWRIEYD